MTRCVRGGSQVWARWSGIKFSHGVISKLLTSSKWVLVTFDSEQSQWVTSRELVLDEEVAPSALVEGTEVIVNTKKLGYDVCCFIGINLNAARDYHSALEKLNALDEVVEAYYTTGAYNIFVKLMCKSIEELQFVLIDKLQAIDEVQSTETLISLQNPINRSVNP